MTDPLPTDYEVADGDVRRVIIEKHVHTQVQEPRSSVGPFLAGFLTAAVLACVAAITFFAISDEDDDGNIDFDVPSVGVDVDSDPNG